MRFLEKYPKTFLAGLLLFFLVFFYGKVLWSPNSYLFNASGDGVKNYFTLVSQIKTSSYVQSSAMNYPYGESFMYLDCHPVFTIIIKSVSKVIPFVAEYSIGIINTLMILSIAISAWFLYLIFRHFSVRPFVAVIAAFSIAVLSPQLFRITGHFALGYSFFIPLTWYMYLRFQDSEKKWKWSVLICLNALFWFFTHAYPGMIIVAFLLTCFIIDGILSYRKKFLNAQFWGNCFIQTLLPLFIFWGYIKLTDTHTGRTKNPYGFMESTSSFDAVFLPNHEPLKPILSTYIEMEQNWEGWAYIGIGSVLGIVIFIGYLLYKLIRRQSFSLSESGLSRQLIVTVTASFVILLISWGYPFRWNMEDLLDKFSIIKNFRGIGRFAWVFYFVITVASVTFIFHFFRTSKKPLLSATPALLISLTFLAEGIPYHKEVSGLLTLTPNYFDEKHLDKEWKEVLHEIDFSKYQAIIPLPFYHIGAENFGKEGTDRIYWGSMLLGYHSGLPLTANHSGRTSIWETKNIMQMISPVFYKKEIEKDIKDSRPFLIIYSNEELLECEQDLLLRSKEVLKNKEFTFYEISKQDLFSTNTTKWFDDFKASKEQMISKNGFLLNTSDSTSYLHFDSYDEKPEKITFSKNGAFTCNKKDYTILKQFEKGELKSGKEYVASFWLYTDGYNYGQDIPNGLLFYQVQYSEDQLEWTVVKNVDAGLNVNGNWSLIEIKFSLTDSQYDSSIVLKGDNRSKIRWHIDDLLIREADVDVYRMQNDELFFNNHRIHLRD